VGSGGGGWVGRWVESKFSDRLWLSFSLALAKPNNRTRILITSGRITGEIFGCLAVIREDTCYNRHDLWLTEIM
jgi:hypothetical protein